MSTQFDKLATDVIVAMQPKQAILSHPIQDGQVDIEAILAKTFKAYQPGSAKLGKFFAYGHPGDAQMGVPYTCLGASGQEMRGEIRLHCDLRGGKLYWDWSLEPA